MPILYIYGNVSQNYFARKVLFFILLHSDNDYLLDILYELVRNITSQSSKNIL